MKTRLLLLMALFVFSSIFIYSQPATPQNLKAEINEWRGYTHVKLSWDKIDERGIRYEIYRQIVKDTTSSEFKNLRFPIFHNAYHDYDVKPGNIYNYYVIAKNLNGESQPSDTVTAEIVRIVRSVIVTGKISNDKSNDGLKRALVHFIPKESFGPEVAVTDSNGNYKIKLVPGEYYVSFAKWGYLTEFYDNQRYFKNAGVLTFSENDSLDISAGITKIDSSIYHTISGTVTDTAGQPVQAVVKPIGIEGRMFKHLLKYGRTDSLGNYSVKVLEGDSVALYIHPKNRALMPEFYDNKTEYSEADILVANTNISNIDIILDGKPVYENIVKGQVTNIEDSSLSAVVSLFKIKDDARRPRFRRTVLSDSLGNFEFSNIHPGQYLAFAFAKGRYVPSYFVTDSLATLNWREADTILVEENSIISDINFSLIPIPDSGFARIEGVVNDGQNLPLHGARVYAVDKNNRTVSYTTTDENGRYQLSNLVPGVYSVISSKFQFDTAGKNDVNVDYTQTIEAKVDLVLSQESSVTSNENEIQNPIEYKLSQNYPNPFNPTTIISYQLPESGVVQLKVFNLIGQEVATLVNKFQNEGNYNFEFDAKYLTSGVYFYTLNAAGNTITRKMILMK